MFAKGSRYRNLPESTTLGPKGEWARAKDLRFIPPLSELLPQPARRVLHAVLQGDRLDLLAFKYYGDTTRWWQISDVNPQYPFPPDLLDQRPFVEEVFALEHAGFANRYAQLETALAGVATVRPMFELSFEDDPGDASKLRRAGQSFVEAAVVLRYPTLPATRQAALNQIQARGFRLLRTFAWVEGPNTTEVFAFEDPGAKGDWQSLTRQLGEAPGVARLDPDITDGTLAVVYNASALRRESLVGAMGAAGFSVSSTPVERVGDKIVIPPPQIV
jgi:hypothetical protein